MPRGLNKLSAAYVKAVRIPGRHSDGGGLYLSIAKADAEGKGGRRRWVFMYDRDGKRTELGLGGGQEIALSAARVEAATIRAILSRGGDPKVERARDNVAGVTFGECADAHIEAMSPSWKSPVHAAQWKMSMRDHASPIREKRVADLQTADILAVLQPHWLRAPEAARRLQSRVESVLDGAKAKGLRSGENPARWRGHLDSLLPKRKRLTRGHHPALPYDALPDFMAALRARVGTAARALEFTILTAGRTGEVLGARWDEVDLERTLWVVPAARMKGGREHRVPLSSRAITILKQMGEPTEGIIFTGNKVSAKAGEPLSNMAMLTLLKRMDVGRLTTHGFRSTFRDWGAEQTGFPGEVLEMALAHSVGNKVEAAYRRSDLFEKRRALMEAWAAFSAAQPVGVGDIAAARAGERLDGSAEPRG